MGLNVFFLLFFIVVIGTFRLLCSGRRAIQLPSSAQRVVCIPFSRQPYGTLFISHRSHERRTKQKPSTPCVPSPSGRLCNRLATLEVKSRPLGEKDVVLATRQHEGNLPHTVSSGNRDPSCYVD